MITTELMGCSTYFIGEVLNVPKSNMNPVLNIKQLIFINQGLACLFQKGKGFVSDISFCSEIF